MLTQNLRMTSICLGDHMATYYHFCAIFWNIVCLTIHLYTLSLLSITCKIEVFSPISLIQKRQLLAILGNGFLPCSNMLLAVASQRLHNPPPNGLNWEGIYIDQFMRHQWKAQYCTVLHRYIKMGPIK